MASDEPTENRAGKDLEAAASIEIEVRRAATRNPKGQGRRRQIWVGEAPLMRNQARIEEKRIESGCGKLRLSKELGKKKKGKGIWERHTGKEATTQREKVDQ